TQTVNQGSTSSTLSSSANPSNPGATVTLTAAVAAVAPASGVASGTVTFTDGTTVLGSATLVNGSASLTVPTLSGGAHSINVSYAGRRESKGGTSGVVTQNVRDSASTTPLTAPPNPVRRRSSVTFTATVKPVLPATATPTGTVTFLDGNVVIGTATL